MTFSPEAYLWFKTLLIVGVVVWFAGLFYLARLFIYHVETEELAPELQQPFRDQYTPVSYTHLTLPTKRIV